MSWEQFVQIGTTIIYWTLIWFLAAIPAAVLIYAIGRFAPNNPGEAASRLMAGRPGHRNRALGKAGEERAFHHERGQLITAGRQDLANKVRWVSEEDGDGLGYDILSFEANGCERLIEVKTTNGWERTPFHISRNECQVAQERRDEWHLLRLWNFAREPKAFEIRPPLERHLSLTPTSYLASFQSS